MNQTRTINILDVSEGAIQERINIEIRRALENIVDPNTDGRKVRTVSITLSFKARDPQVRDEINLDATVKSNLAPYTPVTTTLWTEQTREGIAAVEARKKDRNQITIDEERGEAVTNVIAMPERKKV